MIVPQVHISAENGHDHTVDCWCEPIPLGFFQNNDGTVVFVIQHENYTYKHRDEQLAERDRGEPAAIAWIDRILGRIYNKGA